MRGFVDGESAKGAKLDDLCELRIDFLQTIERLIERENRQVA